MAAISEISETGEWKASHAIDYGIGTALAGASIAATLGVASAVAIAPGLIIAGAAYGLLRLFAGDWTSISEDVIDKKLPDLKKALVSGALGAGSQWLTGALKADSYLIGALGNGNKEAAGVVIERIGVLFDFGLGLINDDQAAKGYSKEDKDDNVVYRDLDVIMVSAKRLTPSLISELARKIMRGAFKKHADLY